MLSWKCAAAMIVSQVLNVFPNWIFKYLPHPWLVVPSWFLENYECEWWGDSGQCTPIHDSQPHCLSGCEAFVLRLWWEGDGAGPSGSARGSIHCSWSMHSLFFSFTLLPSSHRLLSCPSLALWVSRSFLGHLSMAFSKADTPNNISYTMRKMRASSIF